MRRLALPGSCYSPPAYSLPQVPAVQLPDDLRLRWCRQQLHLPQRHCALQLHAVGVGGHLDDWTLTKDLAEQRREEG